MAKKTITITMTLPNGKRKYFRGATKKEAEAKKQEAIRKLQSGVDIASTMKVDALCKLWLEKYKKGTVRDVTYKNLSMYVNAWLIPEIGRMRVVDVKPVHIRTMLANRSDLSKGTLKHLLSTTRAVFDVAVENEMISRNPCLRNIKVTGDDTEEVKPLTKAQVSELLTVAKDSDIYLFVLLALNAGLRRSELLGLMWKDVNFTDGTITVERTVTATERYPKGELMKTVKTSAANRVVPLSKDVLRELAEAKATSMSLYIISGENDSFLTISLFNSRWRALNRGLSFKCHPHQLRHTCITSWVADSKLDVKEVQYLAGHSKVGMTLDVYTHYIEEDRLSETKRKIQNG